MFEKIQRWYIFGLLSKESLIKAVDKNLIFQQEYNLILKSDKYENLQ